MIKRLIASVLLVAITLTSGACLGRMAVSGKVRQFNVSVVENRFAREAVFLVLMIIPVYEIASLIDLLIVNSIEFWSGTNPVDGGERFAEAGDRRYVRADDGSEAISTLLADGSIDIEVRASDGSVHRVNLIRNEGDVVARNANGERLAVVDSETGETRYLAQDAAL